MSSFYLHVPFCHQKCRYCAFDSFVTSPHLFFRYIDALRKEIAETACRFPHLRIETLFIGGGTPTLLPRQLLTALIKEIRSIFHFGKSPEVTVEANPGTVDLKYFRELLDAGVTRLSLGVQSFRDSDLKVLGRMHSVHEARDAYDSARRAGFTNINLDLMYGLPGQTRQLWERTLNDALQLTPEHLSLYQLTLEEQTPLHFEFEQGALTLPEDEEILAMDEVTERLCRSQGMVQYEISNYSKVGYRCQHNVNYWRNGEYWSSGAASVSYIKGKREKRATNPLRYIELVEAGESPVVESERLSTEGAFRETTVMGLRLTEGVDITSLNERFGLDARSYYGETLQRLIERGLLEYTESHIRLTRQGRRFANLVMAELV